MTTYSICICCSNSSPLSYGPLWKAQSLSAVPCNDGGWYFWVIVGDSSDMLCLLLYLITF